MFDKIKNLPNDSRLKQLRDIRVLGLLVFGVIVLLVTWSGVQVIESNYKLERQVVRLEQEIEVKKLENANLKLRNEFYNTDEYIELQARRQFGKAAAGEKLVLVPKEVALARTVELPKPSDEEIKKTTPRKPLYQRNLELWMSFFLHRELPEE